MEGEKESPSYAEKEAAIREIDRQLAELEESPDKPEDDLSHLSHLNHSAIFATFAPMVKDCNKKLQEFPVDALPDSISVYVKAVSESLQVPVDMVASFVIAILSACVQGKYEVFVKEDWINPINLYSVVVARPSERKSPTLKEVTAPIFEYVKKENERRKPDIAEYELKKKILTGRLKTIETCLSKAGDKVKYTMQDALDCQKELEELEEVSLLEMILDDVTPEALVKALKENNEHVAIVSAEGGIFGTMAGRYTNNTNIDIFLKAWAGEPYSTARIGREGINLEHPLLVIVLAVQPQVIMDIMENNDFRGRGLLARFLYCIPNTKVGERIYRSKPINPFVREQYRNLIFNLLDVPEEPFGDKRLLRLSKEADQISEEYDQWIEHQLCNELEPIEDWAGKLHGNTMRIAAIFHLVEYGAAQARSVPIDKKTMLNAISAGKYYLEHAQAAFDIMGLSDPEEVKDAKYIIKRLEQNNKNSNNSKSDYDISKRDLFDLCKGHLKTTEEMDPGLRCLEEHGYIAIRKENTGRGRPSERIYINPEYYKWKEEQNDKRRI